MIKFFTSYKFYFGFAIYESFWFVYFAKNDGWSVWLHFVALASWIFLILNKFNSRFNYNETEKQREHRLMFHEFGRSTIYQHWQSVKARNAIFGAVISFIKLNKSLKKL